ncbi:heme ABC exporter ATP-binding protein CcmA [Caenimonas sp. SL110]|uniref:heme ABC exporter ATP-binding protein CcmA n=1 Tax=Caenimonas sp. SL110 TaxID=1450524 RepID=UPI0006531CD4|nr:heme ABC exporter ATP-binding protein CcmA [Caenimonas sp. SL110]
MTSERVLLRASGLGCDRGGQRVCSGQDLSLTPGDAVWLRGRNGSGKTSLLRVLAGLAAPQEGELWRAPGLRTLYIGHANALKDDLTVAENLGFLARLCGLETSATRHEQALRQWGLWSRRHRPARTLSQGLRRRVALARLALAEHQPLWLLDEPFDALDDEGVNQLRIGLEHHRARGGACVLTSHLVWADDQRPRREHWLQGDDAS